MIKRAFTLIELLVVIAIIAILAAILFPVFAQAKEAAKKTAALSNVKQNALGIIMYSTDYDDTFPLSSSISAGTAASAACDGKNFAGYTLQNSKLAWAATIPAGADAPGCGEDDKVQWINATDPYRKSWELTQQPGKAQVDGYAASLIATFVAKPQVASFTINGLLNGYSATAVASPSQLPLLWPGSGPYNVRALNFTNPSLDCNANSNAPCRFNASGSPQQGSALTASGGFNRGDTYWSYTVASGLSNSFAIYSGGLTMSRADSSAKFYRVASGVYGLPGRLYDNAGVISATMRCNSDGANVYIAAFRPDSTYHYAFTTNAACNN
jgi:prepilin-type N-terminal cleavage/methylation domain-containing protein